MDAPLEIILRMVETVLSNTLGTLSALFRLFRDLTLSLGAVAGMGTTGFLVAAIVLGLVLFFLGKFLLKSWKTIILMFVVGTLIIWFLMAGT